MNIKKVYIHISDSDNPYHDDIKIIDEWHKARGWKKVGYHLFIKSDGSAQIGRQFFEQGAHVKDHNENTLGICLHGRSINRVQRKELIKWCLNLAHAYRLDSADFMGHYETDNLKTCPNMDMIFFRKQLNKEGLK